MLIILNCLECCAKVVKCLQVRDNSSKSSLNLSKYLIIIYTHVFPCANFENLKRHVLKRLLCL